VTQKSARVAGDRVVGHADGVRERGCDFPPASAISTLILRRLRSLNAQLDLPPRGRTSCLSNNGHGFGFSPNYGQGPQFNPICASAQRREATANSADRSQSQQQPAKGTKKGLELRQSSPAREVIPPPTAHSPRPPVANVLLYLRLNRKWFERACASE